MGRRVRGTGRSIGGAGAGATGRSTRRGGAMNRPPSIFGETGEGIADGMRDGIGAIGIAAGRTMGA